VTVLTIDPVAPQPALIAQAVALLRTGQPVVFPTDTVYGLGIAVLPTTDAAAALTLYELKQRDAGKPIPWLVPGADALATYAQDLPPYAYALARAFWPGALTLVARAAPAVPVHFQAPNGTIALRMPAHPIALALLHTLGVPLTATSANRQGEPPATSRGTLDPFLAQRVPLVIDGGPTPTHGPSTVVDCQGPAPRILREGALARQAIEAACQDGGTLPEAGRLPRVTRCHARHPHSRSSQVH